MKIDGIEFHKYVSDFVPEGKVIVWEQYLNNFVLVSHKELRSDLALCAIGLYLKEAKTRPAYRNLRERLLGEQIQISWSDMVDEAKSKVSQREYRSLMHGSWVPRSQIP